MPTPARARHRAATEKEAPMAGPTEIPTYEELMPLPLILEGLPILFEDDEEEEHDVGDAEWHFATIEILHLYLQAHLAARPEYRVHANMNLSYKDVEVGT